MMSEVFPIAVFFFWNRNPIVGHDNGLVGHDNGLQYNRFFLVGPRT